MSSKHKIYSDFINEFAIRILIRRKILSTVALFLSRAACIVAPSWLILWIILELNTLSFCFILKIKCVRHSSVRVKYFLIQSITSAMFLFLLHLRESSLNLQLTCLILGVKAARGPFQEWFIVIVHKISLLPSTLLITWQKIAPIFILMFIHTIFVWFLIAASVFIGGFLQINKNNFKNIIAYSSVFNLGWIIISTNISTKLFFIFTGIYWSAVLLSIKIIFSDKLFSIRAIATNSDKTQTILIMSNLGGIPPMPGFLSKWLLLKELIINKVNFAAITFLIIRAINLFIYLKIISKVSLKSSETQLSLKRPKNALLWVVATSLSLVIASF